MGEWPTRSVERCLTKLRLASGNTLQTQDYRPAGRFPIVDQGQSRIAGWTDDDSGVIDHDLPVVVFGDHTRALKFIDFPFVRGADGTQVLRPTPDIDPLFFFYALRAIDLPSRGYNRHFKALKEKEIGIPGDAEQVDLARVLERVESALETQNQQIATWQACKRAAMQALFTKGLRGETLKETDIGSAPESWELLPISQLGEIITGSTPPTGDRANYEGGDIPFIAPGDIAHGFEIASTAKMITGEGLKRTRAINGGATCFVCIGSTIGKVGYAAFPSCATNQQINSIIANERFESRYVFYLMTFWANHVRKQASPSPVPILSKGGFERVEILATPDADEQRDIIDILDAVDRKIDLYYRKHSVLNELFQALLHKLMNGEVRVANLDLSALDSSPVAEVAA